jgi:hypothetical protein
MPGFPKAKLLASVLLTGFENQKGGEGMKVLRLLILLAALGGPAMPVVNMHGIGPATAYADNNDQGDDNDDQGEDEP